MLVSDRPPQAVDKHHLEGNEILALSGTSASRILRTLVVPKDPYLFALLRGAEIRDWVLN